jgi:glycosyltransferase involved in cell wall biosynthesis
VVEAFEKVRTSKKLVMVGNAPYAAEYIEQIRATHDPRILFPGAIYGKGYWQLQSHAFCYIHATEVGGTHPALIEAMGQRSLVVSNDTPENSETLGGAGILYRKNDSEDLAQWLQKVEDNPDIFLELRNAAFGRARTVYSWESVIDRYEQLFLKILKARRQPPVF